MLNRYWFKPKKFGYGASACSWEGWFILFLYIVFIFYITFVKIIEIELYLIFLVSSSFMLILVSYFTTQGRWKWRWG